MKLKEVNVNITAQTEDFRKAMEKATLAAKQLKEAIDAVNKTEILVSVKREEERKRWYQFWK